MQRIFIRCGIVNLNTNSFVAWKTVCRLFAEKTRPLAAIERQERFRDASNELISSIAQPQTAGGLASEISPTSATIPLTDAAVSQQASNVFEIPDVSVSSEVTRDKTPLPFEDIPGPVALKIFEKYWKYVPLLGTQLICSLLINRLTLGQLKWNRNVMPLKYLFNRYGPIVRIHGPISGDIVMIHRPEHIAEVYKQEGETPVRSGIDVLQHYRLHYRKSRLPGPFTMQGTEWTELRANLDKPFAQQLTRYFGKLEMTCDELVQRIRKIRNRQDEVPGDFDQDLSRWGMESFSILLLNRRLGFLEPSGLNAASEPARIIEALTSAHLYLSRCESGFQVWRFFETPYTRKLFAACDVIDGVIGKYIRQAQNKLRNRSASTYQEKNSTADNVEDNGSPILDKLILDQEMQPDDISTLIMDMIILGVQATTNSEAFLLYYLARNPRIQRQLYEEIGALMPSRGSELTQYSLKKMPYLRACIKECLRLRPAFPYVTRVLPKSITLHGYVVPKDTYVIMANQISSHREENFEDPEKFKPERWLSNNTERGEHQAFSSLPFGYGVRSCLGKQMAETEMMLLTAKLIREFRIEYDYADIGSNYMVVNVPNKPLRFRFVDRD
ncbi:probable cytochrome P450 12a5, mitochondrial isoform X1 [Neodiprion virginianus]|uniref:probable cytochrome P450 12a5, mitochondrial isoform X1 n=1 Tax=Neodiprion virginianus TaxID=2961670 RepID=UPI001EE7267F|nr:probable cytochrome P450 12a5, mitochondrial isoform X1 [Neodiprion virginianus]XP_046624866.1 probable cytochrome P450 12a5, mitochondrial isoform X1 [Neodiprion virginianus]